MTNWYEDGITGVHLKNKKQQDRTMKQFMAGDIGPGEMGCGIELTVPKKHTIDQQFPNPNPLLFYIQFKALKPDALLQDVNPIVAKEKEDMYQVTKPRRDNFSPSFLEI